MRNLLLCAVVVAAGCYPGHTSVVSRVGGLDGGAILARARWSGGEVSLEVTPERGRAFEASLCVPFKTGCSIALTAGWSSTGDDTDYRRARFGASIRGPLGEQSHLEIGAFGDYGDDGYEPAVYVGIGVDL